MQPFCLNEIWGHHEAHGLKNVSCQFMNIRVSLRVLWMLLTFLDHLWHIIAALHSSLGCSTLQTQTDTWFQGELVGKKAQK